MMMCITSSTYNGSRSVDGRARDVAPTFYFKAEGDVGVHQEYERTRRLRRIHEDNVCTIN